MQPRPRTPSDSSRAVRVMPGVSIGTRNAVTPCAAKPGPRAGEDDRNRRGLRVGHPHLAARDPIDARRRRLRPPSSAGWRHRCPRSAPTARTRRWPRRSPARAATLLLRVAAGVGDELGDERVGHDERHGHRRARPRDRLDGERVADVVAAGAAPGRRNRHASRPWRGRRANHIERELAGLVDAARPAAPRPRARTARSILEGALFWQ